MWAPREAALEIRVISPVPRGAAMQAGSRGYHTATLEGIGPGVTYFYRFSDGRERPDSSRGVATGTTTACIPSPSRAATVEGNYLAEFGPYPRPIRTHDRGGYGLDAQWSDDFHHALHALLTGETHGYYRDFGDLSHLAKAFQEGFVYAGQY